MLKGNAEEYPGSYIEFRITVTAPGEPRNSLANSTRAGSVYSSIQEKPLAKPGNDKEKDALKV